MGRGLIEPGATPHYRGMVFWRELLHESDIRVDALDGCNLQLPEDALSSMLVNDQERHSPARVPFGKVHLEVSNTRQTQDSVSGGSGSTAPPAGP